MKIFKHDFVTLPKLERVEIDGKRYYLTPEGNKYQSVTSLTGQVNAKAIADWRKRVGEQKANEVTKKASSRGTSVHNICEQYLLNNIKLDVLGKMILEEINPSNRNMFIKIKPLVEKLDNIKLIEGTMYSDYLQLAGTADCVAEYDGELSVIDFKTSNHPKKKEDISHYLMQGAAYGKMYEELFGVTPKNVVIMMAVESLHHSLIFVEPYDECLKLLTNYMGIGGLASFF